jgi:hypothetical protein
MADLRSAELNHLRLHEEDYARFAETHLKIKGANWHIWVEHLSVANSDDGTHLFRLLSADNDLNDRSGLVITDSDLRSTFSWGQRICTRC